MFCYICQEEIIENIFQLICGHEYHINCISQIRKPECPVCKKQTLNIPNIENILTREQADIRTRQIENEVALYLEELKELEKMIAYIEI
jgi:hypothetical protein